MKKTCDNDNPPHQSFGTRIGICNLSIAPPIMWELPWNASNSFAKTLDQLSLGIWTNKHCQWIYTNLQNSLTMIKIKYSITMYISPRLHNIFLIPSLCNDITTLLSFICVFYVRKYRPNFSHKTRVTCDTCI